MSQSGLNVNTCTWDQVVENVCQQITIGFGLPLIGWKKWRDLLPSQSQHEQAGLWTNNNSEKTYEVGMPAKRGKIHKVNLRFARVSMRVRSEFERRSLTSR